MPSFSLPAARLWTGYGAPARGCAQATGHPEPAKTCPFSDQGLSPYVASLARVLA
jgi:hypothetical protein